MATVRPPGAAYAALLAFTTPLLLTSSHHFKGDTALFFGWAAAVVCFVFWEERPDAPRAFLIGVACGVAASGKMIGILLLPTALWFVRRPAQGQTAEGGLAIWRRYEVLCLVGFIAAFSLIDLEMIERLPRAYSKLQREIGEQLHNDTGFDRGPMRLLGVLSPAAFPPVLLLPLLLRRRRLGSALPFLYAAGAVQIALLFVTERYVPRYALPLVVLLAIGGAGGLTAVAGTRRARGIASIWSPGVRLGLLALLVLAFQVPPWLQCLRGYGEPEHRAAFVRYASRELSEDLLIAADLRSLIPCPDTGDVPGLRQRLLFLPKWDEVPRAQTILEWVRVQGATHVLVNIGYADHYRSARLGPGDGQFSDFAERRAFYAALETAGAVEWEVAPGPIALLQPGLRLYRLSAVP